MKVSTNRNDPGNWTGGKVGVGVMKGTKFGIAASAHPLIDIKNITLEQATEIYRQKYWLAAGCEQIEWPLCAAVFDFAVQSGASRARKYLVLYENIVSYMNARDAFLTRWSAKNPGNRGVENRVDILKQKLGVK